MTEVPYLLVADLHCHSWSAFSSIDADGMNSRLRITLNELLRAAKELKKRGGKLMIIAGDLFHVRGSVDPEVFNPVHATLALIADMGIIIKAVPGNHDLKGKETTEIGNSFQTMASISNTTVVTVPTMVWGGGDGHHIAMVPWCSTHDKLREAVNEIKGALSDKYDVPRDFDLIIHAGIDGVLNGVPPGGLSPVDVAGWGFNRVFAGHYHDHKIMEGRYVEPMAGPGSVVSIGATTHQTWSDIGTRAGFIFVYPDHIEWQASHAPEFVEITGETDTEEVPLIVDGNYVRIRAMKLSDPDIKLFRGALEDMGARGVSFQVAREAILAREGVVRGTASTLDQSVDKYIETLTEIDMPAVKAECVDVLNQIRSVAA
jgi:DNA repair exonuclease SbcCD nuclease subunit